MNEEQLDHIVLPPKRPAVPSPRTEINPETLNRLVKLIQDPDNLEDVATVLFRAWLIQEQLYKEHYKRTSEENYLFHLRKAMEGLWGDGDHTFEFEFKEEPGVGVIDE